MTRSRLQNLQIAVLPGDGIGLEVMPVCIELLDRTIALAGATPLSYETLPCGAGLYQETGNALPDGTVARARNADAILLGAMGLPHIRYPDGSEIVPQIELREILELYAGVRPVRTFPGLPVPLSDPRAQSLDLVLIRESTEGLFAGRGKTVLEADEAANDTMRITRQGSDRLFDFAFSLARHRKKNGKPGRVTLIDKANVLGSMAFFRTVFDERAAINPDVAVDRRYVDAMALSLIRNPWDFDVLVTENMFGDILSDEGAALMGGLGFAPSADIGHDHAVFQPCHGTAPDIMGTGKANPTAMILSGAMMLEWLAERHNEPGLGHAAKRLTTAVEQAFATGTINPCETGGSDGLKQVHHAIVANLA
jgi:3-isopropylmalate dehydrogenase